ncbi:hypothetical protein BS47DRAFT_568885 [Hydnum rufescens UP504]|uniref:MOSC domain-containing protein n=1 Tax=Hydnum rufescens UP504 TaxID=1448309 RepID=A0A9P6B3P2_9AGAM|nr:hypothetical protein BS47DRAFT_568885 [Hydnum rufescens UP504]
MDLSRKLSLLKGFPLNPFAGSTRPPPEQNITVSRLIVYPIKSCGGVDLDKASITREGFEFDRNWMIVDLEKNKQLSARDSRGIKLILVKVAIKEDPNAPHGGTLDVAFPADSNLPSLSIPLRPSETETKDWEVVEGFDIFGSVLHGLVVPPQGPNAPDPSAIFSAYTHHSVKLVMRPHSHSRPIDCFDISPSDLKYPGGPCSSFADISPFMLASTASLFDAQHRIEDARTAGKIEWTGDVKSNVTMDRWRPNWVVEGVETPFGEDDWLEGQVGESEHVFIFPHRTPRCMFPNVDPVTGIRDPHVPHKVMMAYRRVDEWKGAKNKYCFGVYGIPVGTEGVICVGDRIKITKYRSHGVVN